jgi:competence protein ComEA
MRRHYIAQQQTLPQPAILPPPLSPIPPIGGMPTPQSPIPVAPVPSVPTKKKLIMRMIAVSLVIGLVGAIYIVWYTPTTTTTTTTTTTSSSTNVSQQNFATTAATVSTTDGIRVYVVGAVKNPGIYTLAQGARVYDLIQAAGGTLPTANLVAINLAAKLSDGQEVYIAQIGETPPTTLGGVPNTGNGTSITGGGSSSNTQLVNINTATIDELTQNLHISKKSAQTIIDYRTQHGDFSSVDQLALVVSRTIYNKIKAQCTV